MPGSAPGGSRRSSSRTFPAWRPKWSSPSKEAATRRLPVKSSSGCRTAQRNDSGWGRYSEEDGSSNYGYSDSIKNPNIYRVVCVTDLGLSVRTTDSGILVWVTSLSKGVPVSGAKAEVYSSANVLVAKGVTGRERDDLYVLVAGILDEIGDWKRSILYYETGMGNATVDKKTIHKRIAAIARRNKDYQRAMTAYADAADLCDRIEGKDEMKMLKNLAGIMSKAIRNKTSLSDANDVFNKTEDTLGGLELDEL